MACVRAHELQCSSLSQVGAHAGPGGLQAPRTEQVLLVVELLPLAGAGQAELPRQGHGCARRLLRARPSNRHAPALLRPCASVGRGKGGHYGFSITHSWSNASLCCAVAGSGAWGRCTLTPLATRTELLSPNWTVLRFRMISLCSLASPLLHLPGSARLRAYYPASWSTPTPPGQWASQSSSCMPGRKALLLLLLKLAPQANAQLHCPVRPARHARRTLERIQRCSADPAHGHRQRASGGLLAAVCAGPGAAACQRGGPGGQGWHQSVCSCLAGGLFGVHPVPGTCSGESARHGGSMGDTSQAWGRASSRGELGALPTATGLNPAGTSAQQDEWLPTALLRKTRTRPCSARCSPSWALSRSSGFLNLGSPGGTRFARPLCCVCGASRSQPGQRERRPGSSASFRGSEQCRLGQRAGVVRAWVRGTAAGIGSNVGAWIVYGLHEASGDWDAG